MATTNFETLTINQVRGYAGLITKTAKEYAPNNHLKNNIVSTVEISQGKYIIRVRVTGPDARAREYGSGIHARRSATSRHQLGPKGKILIRPKAGKKFLAFPWDVANDNIPRLPDGRVLLREVQHPGVEAANNGKGYIAPAVNDVRKQIRERFGRDVARGIRLDIRAAFKGAR